jgi:hypothetical protein
MPACAATAAADVIDPVARNALLLVRAPIGCGLQQRDDQDRVLRFGQSVRLVAHPLAQARASTVTSSAAAACTGCTQQQQGFCPCVCAWHLARIQLQRGRQAPLLWVLCACGRGCYGTL